MTDQVIKFRCYNLSFDYVSVLKDYLNRNYGGTYQCIGIDKYSYRRMRYLDDKDLEEGDTISKIAKMRNINTNEIIDMEMYNYDECRFYSIKVYLTPAVQKIFSREQTNAYPTVQDRGETIFNILIAEQQMENEVSPNLKQVIQNSDLNRYLMGFI